MSDQGSMTDFGDTHRFDEKSPVDYFANPSAGLQQ